MALKLFKSLLFGACIISLGGAAMAQASTSTGNAKSESWDKTFAKSPKVEVQKVSFKNRYGIVLVGDLYIPKDLLKNPPKDSKKHKAPRYRHKRTLWGGKRTSFWAICTNSRQAGLYHASF